MKSLYQYLSEDGGAPGTPGNTMGMGEPVIGDDGGSEPLPKNQTAKPKTEKAVKPKKHRKKKKGEEE